MADDGLFPVGSFCIELSDEDGDKMFDLLERNNIPFEFLYEGTYTGGCVSCNCRTEKPEKEIMVVLELSDDGKNWLASPDYLKRSKDGVFVRLITPDNPDDGRLMPEFKDVFKVFEATDENLKRWADNEL